MCSRFFVRLFNDACRLKSDACIPLMLKQDPNSHSGILAYVKGFLGKIKQAAQIFDLVLIAYA